MPAAEDVLRTTSVRAHRHATVAVERDANSSGWVVSVIETRDEDRSKKIIQLDRRVFASSIITFFLRHVILEVTTNYMCSMTYTFSNNLGQYRTKNHINSRLESEFE